MTMVCLDMEGVLVPEIWIEVAKETGIEELKKTTRDEPDYDKLMKYRIDILNKHNLSIEKIQSIIAKIELMDGAKEFLDKLREITNVVIISDTFEQFLKPIAKKLNWPTIICNNLVIDENGKVIDYKMRCDQTKLTTVNAFHTIGIETIASGDSYNDIGMIKNSKAGFLFKSTEKIKSEYPEIKALETYDELFSEIKKAL
ncbi:MAG: bifunctional phosphoserine phosphatase/homoserine phosphotransferase ThrH [Clostridia bacterium]|nr:bifunctional phosphoserine phosphatase/homoserine phosphotransferase ThrH [Clostridia bacterium]